MTNDDTERIADLERRVRIGKGEGFAMGLQIATYTTLFGIWAGGCLSDSYWKQRLERASMVIYEPVGNGGALAAMHGKISPERQKMYATIEAIRTVR